ncbi:autophagy-related protein 9 [Karstenula rhodostoma CBS 690.94]|uniref:Autophagy-related protein 9 n=1 Tax=Karstenula rhodostoma CBS 690.94 TaxID=1392251 RepID=A0A9P4PK04_9PLEO|nr:autophagy-related protein 9 [Karstenula rhodostoma CBS 690.94]
MASNLFSRILPSASDEPYDTEPLNPHRRYRSSSAGTRSTMDIDNENLDARFEDLDLEHLLDEAAQERMTESAASVPQHDERAPPGINTASRAAAWRHPVSSRPLPPDDDDDVPQSLLLEGGVASPNATRSEPTGGLPPPVPGPSTRHTRAQWETTRRQQRLHDDGRGGAAPRTWRTSARPGQYTSDPKERAMWLWVNQTDDLDNFLAEVYDYYTGSGMYSILLRKLLMLLQTAFVIGFLTFLGWCIDYSKLPGSHKLSEVMQPKCMHNIHGIWWLALCSFIVYWLWSIVKLVGRFPRLQAMHDFYHHLLEIPDRDIQTVQWQHVVGRMMALRDANLTTASNLTPEVRKLLDSRSRQRLDAVDIASRLMRRDNYLIALFNKEILDVSIPIPFLGNRFIFSETTRFHVNLAIMDFVFSGPNGSFNQDFLRERNRRNLVATLRTRLMYTGFLSVLCAPFAVVYFLASYLFARFTEYHKNPSLLGDRDFTPFAQWKFREFNELPHLFNRRRNMAYPAANLYLQQFPKVKTEMLFSFVAFITGAFCTVLILITLIDSELFLNFEITPGRTALFYMTLLSGVYLAARGSSPQEDQVADPAYYIDTVIYHTRYEPASWHDRLHSDEVREEFSRLYQPKILLYVEEMLSILITPFILMFRLPKCSERIVDFFREFSIVVDGLGVVCSYSMFPFKKGENNLPANRTGRQQDNELREDYFMANDNKMMASYHGFMETYATATGRGHTARFHPPPQFPTHYNPASQSTSPVDARGTSRGPVGRQPFNRRAGRHGPAPERGDPMSSVLLDPIHQPSGSVMGRSPRQGPQGRHRSAFQPLAVPEESMVSESWQPQQDDETEDDNPGAPRGGVLQLLHQFSRAQAEGRAGGAGV